MVQVTPYQPPNTLQAIALGQQHAAQNRQLAQRDRQLNQAQDRLTMAAEQMGINREQAAKQMVGEIVGNSANAQEAILLAEYLFGEKAPPGTFELFNQLPPEAYGRRAPQEKFSQSVQKGVGPDGQPVFFQASDQGNVRQLPGVVPIPAAGERIDVGPDGGISITRGGSALGTSTANKVQTQILEDSEILAKTRNVLTTFKPEYQTLEARFDAAVLSGKAKLDPNSLSEPQKAFLGEFADYKANAAQLQSQVINQLAGAAVSESEAKRINGFLIDPGAGLFDGDDPITAEAKLKRYDRNVTSAIARKNWFLRNGLEANESNWNKYTLADMPDIIKQRHQEIVAELSRQNPDMTAAEITQNALQIGKREFGLL